MTRDHKVFIPFLAAGLLCFLISMYACLRPSGLVYAFFRMTDLFWAHCGFALGLICFGIAFFLLCRYCIRHGGKGTVTALLSVLSILGAGGVMWKLLREDINQYRMHAYVSADRKHTVFGLTVYGIFNRRARRYYVQDGKYSYKYFAEYSLDTYAPSDSDDYIVVENDGVYELPWHTLIYQWND